MDYGIGGENINSKSILMTKIKTHKFNILIMLLSLAVLFYFLYVVVPFADRRGFFSEHDTPSRPEVIKYILLCFPIISVYLWFIIHHFHKITFLFSLNYPLILINMFLGVFLLLLVMGGAILWLAVFTFIFALVGML